MDIPKNSRVSLQKSAIKDSGVEWADAASIERSWGRESSQDATLWVDARRFADIEVVEFRPVSVSAKSQI